MTDPSPMEQRRARIESLRAKADHLLSIATHETIEAEIRIGISELDEALVYLKEEDIDSRPHIWTIVDLATNSAAWHIEEMEKALTTYGADARPDLA